MIAAGVLSATAAGTLAITAAPASAATSIVPDVTIASLARNSGLEGCKGVNLATWVAIALAESGGNRYAHASVGEDSRGLWQINLRAHSSWVGNRDLYDPATNAWAAAQVCKGSGPRAWSAYTNGLYAKYLSRGNAAAAALGSGSTVAHFASTTSAPATTSPTAWYLSMARNHGVYLDAVRQVQQKLADLGYPISVDGYFGPQTNHMVKDFQAKHGLLVDGIVGPQTHEALFG